MHQPLTIAETDPLAVEVIEAIHAGDIFALERPLDEHAGLANATIARLPRAGDAPFMYPLIGAATDWPGHFPRVGQTIAALVAHGADVNARCSGPHRETPLHGAASTDDLEALDALLDARADIDADGAVIAGGTPLDDAVAFAQWRAARRLVERGAMTALWHAAGLGMLARLDELISAGVPPARHPWGGISSPAHDVNVAFWCACHGGQQPAAEHLLAHGADPVWVAPWDGLTALDTARRAGAADVVRWLEAIIGGSR